MGSNFRITFDVEVDGLTSLSSPASFFTLTDDDITSTANIVGTSGNPLVKKNALPVSAVPSYLHGKKKLVFKIYLNLF